MATDAVTLTGKLASTLGDVTSSNTSGTGVSVSLGTANDNAMGTLDATTTPAELNLGNVSCTAGYAVCCVNKDASVAPGSYIRFAVRTVTVASGSIVAGSYYLVINNTVTYDAVTYAVGAVVTGTATTTHTGSGALVLLVPIGIAYAGEPFGPIRREGHTATAQGAIYYWSDGAIKMERCASEVGNP